MVNTMIELFRAQDFLITEFDYRYCRAPATLTNDTGSELTIDAGCLVVGAVPAVTPHTNDAGVTTVTGILMTPISKLAAAGTQEVVVLNLGPAVVDQDSIFDVAGDTPDAGSLADLVDLNIKAVAGPTLMEEGQPTIPNATQVTP